MFRSAESVSPSHPDKLCDRISDAVLDAVLAQDPAGRVAVETVGGHGQVLVTGEISFKGSLDVPGIVARIAGPGLSLTQNLVKQSGEIAAGVDTGGAGDQGIMVGYATRETPSLMPLEVMLSRQLNQRLYAKWPHDGKTQVTVDDGRIVAVVASFQHAKTPQLKAEVTAWLAHQPAAPKVAVHINPAGEWQQGGFEADTGLTGRKLAVDNYGPHIPLGGGCFSGKDATKVDRSAAYMARKLAVDYLHKLKAQEVYAHLAYAIGVAEPVHAEIVADGQTHLVTGYDLTPAGIIGLLDLRRPQFERTAEYGHFGNDFSWDKPTKLS
jgi:S-adenosylmethionine synthetase